MFHDAFVGGIWDAGTEVNDEVPAHSVPWPAAPNTGTPEMAPVRPPSRVSRPRRGWHPRPVRFQNALVGAPGYPVAMVRVRRALAVTEDRNYVTLANGDMVMPTVGTPATVRGAFLLRDGGTRLVVRLERRMLANVIGMELRLAQPGGDEAVVLTLAGPFAPGGGPATDPGHRADVPWARSDRAPGGPSARCLGARDGGGTGCAARAHLGRRRHDDGHARRSPRRRGARGSAAAVILGSCGTASRGLAPLRRRA
ncbi:MAG: hypothetical protein R3E96_00380 [Planctomycetota bacterium]